MVCICTSRHRARKVYSGKRERPGVGPAFRSSRSFDFAQDTVPAGGVPPIWST